jgi:TetR/AcrR family transcriptional repressor of mexJK operon
MAQKMFIAGGYSAVSMDALAKAVPVSKPTLYHHFKDKKALFTAVMQQRCQYLFDTLEQGLKNNLDARQALTAVGQRFLGVVLQTEAVNMYRIAATEAHQFPDLGKLFWESGPRRAAGVLAAYLKMLHAQGALSVPDPELSAHFFFGMLKSRLQMQCLLGVKKKVSTAEKNRIICYAVDIFLHGHKAH